jgi:hypothetical protein
MKKIILVIVSVAGVMIYQACTNAEARYVDLDSGKKISLERDPHTGLMVDAKTKKPPHIYIDTKKNDTIYGHTGQVINGHVTKKEDGLYVFDEEIKIKNGDDYKMKMEKSGEVKIKKGDSKIKIEKSGERKVKND